MGFLPLDAVEDHVPPTTVVRGPLLEDLEAQPAAELTAYREAGGYALLGEWRRRGRDELLLAVDRAGVRGRGGGGFPAAQKWFQVARREDATKYLVVNGNSGPGDLKVQHLLQAPHKLIEATLLAAFAADARVACLAVPGRLERGLDRLRRACAELPADVRGEVELRVVPLPDAYLAGEETALLEVVEGRPPRPRRKPPQPTSQGLFGAPTAVSNLETVLQALLAVRLGASRYREHGTRRAPGTLLFSLTGDVAAPGLYELPLGTPLGELTDRGGAATVELVFPGGPGSPPLGREQLDVRLDFDSLREAGSDLGSGAVMVLGEGVDVVELSRELADFFHRASCGRCRPCKDGTRRTHLMLSRLDRLERPAVDWQDVERPDTRRRNALRVLDNDPAWSTAISYTDTERGLGKIKILCEFYRDRGDCHHSHEAASSILRLIEMFPDRFEIETTAALAAGARSAAPTVGEAEVREVSHGEV